MAEHAQPLSGSTPRYETSDFILAKASDNIQALRIGGYCRRTRPDLGIGVQLNRTPSPFINIYFHPCACVRVFLSNSASRQSRARRHELSGRWHCLAMRKSAAADNELPKWPAIKKGVRETKIYLLPYWLFIDSPSTEAV